MIPNETSNPAKLNLFNLFASKKLCIKCSNVVYNYQLPNSFQVENMEGFVRQLYKIVTLFKNLIYKIQYI